MGVGISTSIHPSIHPSQEVSLADVRKEINFCRKVNMRVAGVVENMARLSLPVGGLAFRDAESGADVTGRVREALAQAGLADVLAEAGVFHVAGGGTQAMCEHFGVPFLGSIPMDPAMR